MTRFRLVTDESLPSQKVPKKARGKVPTFNVLDEMEDPNLDEGLTFSVKADLYDYGNITFRSINSLVSYVSQKGFPCYIYLERKLYGYWSPENGITKYD